MENTTSLPDRIAVVLAGGAPAGPLPDLDGAALVIAADGGLAQLAASEHPADIVVGDMDSVTDEALAKARADGAEIERHPEDKDATDLELALDRAVAAGCNRVIVVGGGGGRLDHLIGNALLLARESYCEITLEWWAGPDRATVVRPGATAAIAGSAGDVVSLLPAGGPAHGVTTEGLRWALDNESLEAGSTRGLSNEMSGGTASVTLREGALLAVHRSRDEVQ